MAGLAMTIRIAAVSDLHGHLSHSIPECDVLCIVGDIPPLYSTAEDWKSYRELEWVKTKFLRWLKRQPFKRCLVVWGNHDIFAMDPMTRGEAIAVIESIDGVSVIENEPVMVEGVLFAGYPYTPTIQKRNWAFSMPRGHRQVGMSLDHIHPDTDVLLSHGPPLGFLDQCDNGNVGCAMLAKKVIEVAPRVVFCGHIHECRGQRASMWNALGKETRIINVSICDRNYTPKGAKVQTYDFIR